MLLQFIGSKPNKNCIKVCSDKGSNCDVYINNFVHIMNAGNSFNSFIMKERFSRDIILDISHLKKVFIQGFLNRVIQSFYEFNKYKTEKNKEISIKVYAPQLSTIKKKHILELQVYAKYTRDLINEPSNKSNPSIFANASMDILKKCNNVKVKILDALDIRKEGLGLIDSIGSSSAQGARLLVIEYSPANSQKTICLIGKGVTIDTGGYSLKDSRGMYNMHMDKTGASICVGLIKNLAETKYKNKVVAVIPLVENVISDNAAKPGDVVKAFNGQTVEIVNVDAEGRLILADALSYSCRHYNPNYILDFATLTGWSEMIHCHTSFTYYTLNKKLSKMVESIGENNSERSFHIPSWPEYSQYLESDKADVKNFGFKCMHSDGFMASIFLMNFIPAKYRKQWIHFDIRNTCMINSLSIADGFATYLEIIKGL